MFVDHVHVRCLHNQIQTVLKMCSTKKNYIQIYDTESEQSLMLFIYSQVVINTRPYWYTQLRFLLDRFKLLRRLEIFACDDCVVKTFLVGDSA
jgi:hypothetical protein